MFYETSHEKLFFTESWPTSTSTLKRNFSKSFNSLNGKKAKSFPNHNNSNNSFSSTLSNSLSKIVNKKKLGK